MYLWRRGAREPGGEERGEKEREDKNKGEVI